MKSTREVHGLISHYTFRTGASEVWRGWLGGLASEAKQIQLGEAAVACGYDKWAAAAARLPAKWKLVRQKCMSSTATMGNGDQHLSLNIGNADVNHVILMLVTCDYWWYCWIIVWRCWWSVIWVVTYFCCSFCDQGDLFVSAITKFV